MTVKSSDNVLSKGGTASPIRPVEDPVVDLVPSKGGTGLPSEKTMIVGCKKNVTFAQQPVEEESISESAGEVRTAVRSNSESVVVHATEHRDVVSSERRPTRKVHDPKRSGVSRRASGKDDSKPKAALSKPVAAGRANRTDTSSTSTLSHVRIPSNAAGAESSNTLESSVAGLTTISISDLLQYKSPTAVRRDRGTNTEDDLAYPTVAAERAKVARKKREEELMKSGGEEAVKQSRKRKPQKQESHHDDCGSDVDLLEETSLQATCHTYDPLRSAFFDDCSFHASLTNTDFDHICQHEVCRYDNDDLELSAVDEYHLFNHDDPCSSNVDQFFQILDESSSSKEKDVVEICGGEGGVIKVAVSRKLAVGHNFDIRCGIDLTKEEERHKLMKYIDIHKPLCIVMSPPCTAFANWSRFNKVHNSATWQRSRNIGEVIAEFCAEVIVKQLSGGRHFFLEQPKGSDMFMLPCLTQIRKSGKIHTVDFPQCALGLVSPEGQPLLKWTTVWTSHFCLAEPFMNLRCTHDQHGDISGSFEGRKRSKLAQVWTLAFCRKVVFGIEALKAVAVLPSKDGSGSTPQSAFPLRRSDIPDAAIFDCQGCKWGRVSTDKSHTRNTEPPGLCRHPHVKTIVWKCAACEAHAKTGHTNIEGECRMPGVRKTHGKKRGAGPHRDPGVPASGSAEDRNPLTGPEEDFAPHPESASSGSALVPAQAGTVAGPNGGNDVASDAGGGIEVEAPGGGIVSDSGATAGSEIQIYDPDAAITEGVLDALTPANAREFQLTRRRARLRHRDAAVNAGGSAQEDWRHFDVSRAMATLSHPSEDVARRSIQRLHVRWYHATQKQMCDIFRAAGVPSSAVDLVKGVVQGCHVCRDWHRPAAHNVAAFRLSLKFNEEVQFDLMFYTSQLQPERGSLTVMHLVDTCIRWDVSAVIAAKTEDVLCAAITTWWISIFGPMEVLTLDEETGMRGQTCSDWAASHTIELKFKAPRQKAWLVERHNELLRQSAHSTEGQLIKEGISCTFEEVLASVVFAKNALTVINNATPYQALFGRQPAMLPPIEEGSVGALEDSRPSPGTKSRHHQRVRETAACNIIEANAKARVERGDRSRTRGATELADHAPGDLVDIWFDPVNKDTPGWRGPATMKTINHGDGNVTVRYQGRSLDRTGQEVRRHIAYLVFLSLCHPELIHFWNMLRDFTEALVTGTSKTCGLVLSTHRGWLMTNFTHSPVGNPLFKAGISLAQRDLHLHNCVSIRFSRGQPTIGPLQGFTECEMWCWLPNHDTQKAPWIFTSDEGDCSNPCNLKSVCHDLGHDVDYTKLCTIQFWAVSSDDMPHVQPFIPAQYMPPKPPKPSAPRDVDMPQPGTKRKDNTPDGPPTPRQPPGPPGPPAPPPPPPAPPPPPPPGLPAVSLLPDVFLPSPVPSSYSGSRTDPGDWPPPYEPDMLSSHNTPAKASSTYTRSRTPHSQWSQNTSVAPNTPGSDRTIWYPENIPALPGSWQAASSQEEAAPLLGGNSGGSGSGAAPSQEGAAPGPILPFAHPHSPTDDEDDEYHSAHEADNKYLSDWRAELENHDNDEGDDLDDPPGARWDDYIHDLSTHLAGPPLLTHDSCFHVQDFNMQGFTYADEVEIACELPYHHTELGANTLMRENEICLTYLTKDNMQRTVITKEFDSLTKEELIKHHDKVAPAKLGELRDLHNLGCYERMPRRLARNIVDTRWVIRWKLVDGDRIIKVRLTMRGFKDTCINLETFAGTATRWSQRVVNSATANEEDFVLFSFDVSKAFAKGMTFEELSRITGEKLRVVQFEVTPEDAILLRKIPGFEGFDPATEVLSMIKAVYGLKDAPRAWRKKLHEVLTSCGLYPTISDPQVYIAHHPRSAKSDLAPSQGGADETHARRKLKCIISTHVDDLKGGATRRDAEALLKHLNVSVGTCTQEWGTFTHTGIEHVQSKEGINTHQNTYAQQLQPIDITTVKDHPDEELATDAFHSLYMSLLGGIAWLVLTRVDISVFVQALQRRAHAPRVCDLKRLNIVTRYAKRRPLGLFYGKLLTPNPKLLTFSDAAFKALVEESSGLALRGCVILLADTAPNTFGSKEGRCHMLEFICRRQRRVVRSTFSAELNGLIDSVETAILIQIMLFELWFGCGQDSSKLANMQEDGTLTPEIWLSTDARAVYDAIAATDACEPAECSLKLHLLALRDKIRRNVVRYLFWLDTRDMLADGLTKGTVDRQALRHTASTGLFTAKHESLHTPNDNRYQPKPPRRR